MTARASGPATRRGLAAAPGADGPGRRALAAGAVAWLAAGLACAGPASVPSAPARADEPGPASRPASAGPEGDAAPVPKDSATGAVPKDSSIHARAAGEPVREDRSTPPVPGDSPVAEPVASDLPGAPAPLPCAAAPAGMACVPAGPFLRGSDDGPENTRPAARVWLQTFYMDIDEVTYAQYKACVKARRCDPSGPGYTDFDRPQQPINGIRWFDADKYCKAQGKRLPSEAQWEKAARGPDGALHPWGDEPATCERAIIKDARGRSCGVKKLYSKPDTGRPWEVGSRPAYRYGLRDMAGNSWEWVADWYTRSYAECGADCLGVEPRGPCQGAETCPGFKRKLVRGGSWYWDATYATAIHRRPHWPENRPFHHFGFRCAASPEEAARLAAGAGAGEPAAAAGSTIAPALARG